MKLRYAFLVAAVVALLVGSVLSSVPAQAQAGMNKATMKLLVGDLLEAGFSPHVTPNPDGTTYTVVVGVDAASAATAQQVQNFATARSVTARVLTVQFQ